VKSRTTRRFRELLADLPEPIQRQAQEAYRLFRDNPSHPSLRFKSISPHDPTVYSIRIGRGYRAIGTRDVDSILWI
jgi:mRNA-degrading endonuclease RelE of RelBE toxin-antitoxin system